MEAMISAPRMQNQFTSTTSFAFARSAFATFLILFAAACNGDADAPAPTAAGTQATAAHTDAEPSETPPAPIEASRPEPQPSVELAKTPNILLVSVDTLRADHLSIYGYERPTSPAIDAYFANATVYNNAYSAEANTPPSVMSLLSGLYPSRHRVRQFYQRIPAAVPVLPDFLGAAGYETAAVVSNVVLTNEATGLGTRFDMYDDFVDEREENLKIYERRASRTTDAGLAWLNERTDSERPHFLWLHYIDPHGPYERPIDAKTATFDHDTPQPIDLKRVIAYQRKPGVTDGKTYIDRYDEEIAYTDGEIGRFLAAYDALGYGATAIIVLTADHGETMIEHEVYFNHGHQVWNSVMRVPLLVRVPGGNRAIVDRPVSLTDVAPTLLDMIDYPLTPRSKSFDGKPVASRLDSDSISLEAGVVNQTGSGNWVYRQHRALVSGQHKWFASVDRAGDVVASGSFDLVADPGEINPIEWRLGGKANTLLGWFEADPDPAGLPTSGLKGERLEGPKVAPGRTPDQIEALRALGYVE